MNTANEQRLTMIFAGALAHLTRYVETGCPRSAHRSAMLLERIGADDCADGQMRLQALELAETIEVRFSITRYAA